MKDKTPEFIDAARQGRPVYITDVRQHYLSLPAAASFPLDVVVSTIAGGVKRLAVRLPRFPAAGGLDERGDFVVDFFLAELYNILSSLGARRITIVNPARAPEAGRLADEFRSRFGVGLSHYERRGYGKCLNVLDRILAAIPAGEGDGRFVLELVDEEPAPAQEPEPAAKEQERRAAARFLAATKNLEGKTILGVDIGGTDIKLVAARDGRLVAFREFDWYPTRFTRVDELIAPIVRLVREMSEAAGVRDGLFDAIGLCFPDVVVDDKIVGGEVFKTRGIRDALGAAYDGEFAKLTDLDLLLRRFVRPEGVVAMTNDGPMAAFTAGVEEAAVNPDAVGDGVFAYTLGTELGTGWVTEDGGIPRIPLEVYNYIIDLGSWPERGFPADDVRSVNNFNTGLPGTLQRIASQSGVFRMALKYFPESRPDVMAEIRSRGFVAEKDGLLVVPTEPADLRKPFLEYLMGLVHDGGDPAVARVFEEIGVALAVTGEEIDWILAPAARDRMLFGRLVKKPECFRLIEKGASARAGGGRLRVADAAIAATPLMRDLSRNEKFTVAQFAQAVGAVYYANLAIRAPSIQ